MQNNNSTRKNSTKNEESSEDSDDDLTEHQREQFYSILQEIDKCNSQIKKLETMDVNFEDERRSSFLELHRWRKRIINLYYKACDIKGNSKNAGRRLLMAKALQVTGNPIIDDLINVIINRDWFNIPTYSDILDCIEFCNEDEFLEMRKSTQSSLAEMAYVNIVNVLQKMRQQDFYKSFSHIYLVTEDPAKSSQALWNRLVANEEIARGNLNRLCQDFVRREHDLVASRIPTRRYPRRVVRSSEVSEVSTAETSQDISTRDSPSMASDVSPAHLNPQIVDTCSKTVRFAPQDFDDSKSSSGDDPEDFSGDSSQSLEFLPRENPIIAISEIVSDEETNSGTSYQTQMGNSASNFAVSTLNEEHSRFFLNASTTVNSSFRVKNIRGRYESISPALTEDDSDDLRVEIGEGAGGNQGEDLGDEGGVLQGEDQRSRGKCLIV
ncbi:uncharacterized protein [Fopius arisanus]|uniref:Daxx histone-binding domain-containing protein n=1 Tax=Fopius arisanus TaxID=64838 RepID=A0A9R1TL51_9HYME|nr:PREDICTED: uncharacterized protein LOC105271555 [Fopius arisanus]